MLSSIQARQHLLRAHYGDDCSPWTINASSLNWFKLLISPPMLLSHTKPRIAAGGKPIKIESVGRKGNLKTMMLTHRDDPPQEKDSYRSIGRAVALLRAIAQRNGRGARLSRLAMAADLHVATAHRILNVLVNQGLLVYDPVSKLYGLGLELYTLGSSAHRFQIKDRFHSTLVQVAAVTEDSVYLIIPIGYDGLCIDQAEGKTPIRLMTYDIGSQTPMGVGSGSLALLSFLPDERVESILAANARRYQNFNGLTKERLRAAVQETRENGFSISRGTYIEGVIGVGVPIYEGREVIASVSVAAIESRMSNERIFEIADLVRREIGFIAESPSAQTDGGSQRVQKGVQKASPSRHPGMLPA